MTLEKEKELVMSQSLGCCHGNTNSPSKIEGVAVGRGSMTGDGIIPPCPSGALPLSQGESLVCQSQLCESTKKFKSAQWRFILCSMIAYAFFYVTRKNLSMAQPGML